MSRNIRQALIGVGANLGDRERTLRRALDRLRDRPGIREVESSSLFETEPIGVTDQPRFLNLVAGVETELQIRPAARLDGTLRGARAKLTPDRVGYMAHPDWVSRPDKAPPAELWRPEIPTPEGLAATARWYREQGWL